MPRKKAVAAPAEMPEVSIGVPGLEPVKLKRTAFIGGAKVKAGTSVLADADEIRRLTEKGLV